MLKSYFILIFVLPLLTLSLTNCKEKAKNPIIYPLGTFPDTVVNLQSVNSQYDDYNLDINQIVANAPIIFSSNRKSAGSQFDLEQADISFLFDQTNGHFEVKVAITNDAFLSRLIQSATTQGDDLGPYRFFSSVDGYEYLVLSSRNAQGNLDLYYLKNRPVYGSGIPNVEAPVPVNLFNSSSDDAYFCFDTEQDSAYYSSDRNGDFDIYLQKKPIVTEVDDWFNQGFASSIKPDSINSPSQDKCPQIYKKIMVFTSDRPGGLGGFDLYYSILKKGKWSSPVNMGPGINTSSDEYRPVIGYHPDFTNIFMMFSSNRTGGKGGFDLYFTGFQFPKN